MYENFKTQLILKLLNEFDGDDINKIIKVIDVVANDYEIIYQRLMEKTMS